MTDDLIRLTVTTAHPQDYVLTNEADGTRWRGTANGRWVAEPDREEIRIERDPETGHTRVAVPHGVEGRKP